jgi:ABC-2 type transport system permease protein
MSGQSGVAELVGADTVSGGGYTLKHAVAMEVAKARSLPAIRWALIGGMLLTVAIGVVAGANTRNGQSDLTSNVLSGVVLGQLITAVLGTLAITGEAGAGQLAATFCAIPRRGLVLAAKAIVWGVTFLVSGEAAVIVAFFVGTSLAHHGVPRPSFGSDPAVTRAVLTTGLYLALTGLIGLGVGALIWHSGAAIAVTVGGLFVVPLIFAAAGRGFARFMPELIAGNSLAAVKPVQGFTWSPWLELVIVALYPAVLLAVGSSWLARRDV